MVTTPAPDLSIVIVSYQCKRYLLDLLDDLAAARDDLSLDVHVVDNASEDGTPAAVRAAHPWVAMSALPENVGFGRANNLVITDVLSETVLLLNPDTRVTGHALRVCVDEMRRSPDIGILSPRVVDERGLFDRRCMRGFPTLWGVCCHVSGLDRVLRGRRSRRYTLGWLLDDEAADVEAVSGAVMFCRADALRQVGGFDERFFMYAEDIDLCLRATGVGWRVRYWPGASIAHIGGRSGASVRSRLAWTRSIGDLHRAHRPAPWGRFTGRACDAAGLALDWLAHRGTRFTAPTGIKTVDT